MRPPASSENSIEYARPYRNGGPGYFPLADQIMVVNRPWLFNEDGQVLLVQKSPVSNNGGGLWHPPGGKQEIGERPDVSVRREVREETALEIIPNIEFGPLSDSGFYPDPVYVHYEALKNGREARGILRVTKFHVALVPKAEPILSSEETAYVWTHPRRALEESRLLTLPTLAALGDLVAKMPKQESLAD